MKKFLMSIMLLLAAISTQAIPARPGQLRNISLPDGTRIEVRLVGDEHGHYWLAANGRAFQQTDNGFEPINLSDLRSNAQKRRTAVNRQRVQRLQERRKLGQFGDYTGQKKCLIILVNFSNVAFKTANNNALYQRIANEENFAEGRFVGSMYDYFKAQSEGQFELTFDVAGPVTVSNTQSYYGGNDYYGNDKHAAEMVIEAVNLVANEVDFADYDWDGDGYVDQIYVVYAGKGEADGGASSTIWPHAYDLNSAAYYGDGTGEVSVGGVKVNNYACGSELNGSGSLNGIGVMCHEFSHCLGYPDFYDIDYSGGQGMYNWDLMDMGSYNGDGYRPAGYSSYERWMAGWRDPIELTKHQAVTDMKSLENGGDSYVIYNDGNRNEYFLLENRQPDMWDAGLPGKGMLIVHVDYDANVWEMNQPNDDPDHQRMTWVPADGSYNATTQSYGGQVYVSISDANLARDTYPSGSYNSFSDTSASPAALYNKNTDGSLLLHKSVNDITQHADGTISFNFRGVSTLQKPEFSVAAGLYHEAQSVTLSTTSDDATIYFTTDGTTPTRESEKYEEPILVAESLTLQAIAATDDDESEVASARYVIRLDADTVPTTFRLVTSTADIVSGKRYAIACASKQRAAGPLNGKVLSSKTVETQDDYIMTGDDVAVFYLDATSDGYTLMTSEGKYLYATAVRQLAEADESPAAWTLADADSTVTLTYGSLGTILYNVSSPRFTTYTSRPNSAMLLANLYVESLLPEKQASHLAFDTDTLHVTAGTDFSVPTLVTEPEGLSVTYTIADETLATIHAATGQLTLVADSGSTTITATFAGNLYYEPSAASYVLSVKQPEPEPVEPGFYFEVSEVTTEADNDDFVAPVLVNPNEIDVVYATSDAEIAAVDTLSGAVVIGSTTGTATITASFAGNRYFLPGEAHYDIVVTEPVDLAIGMTDAGLSGSRDGRTTVVTDLSGRRVATLQPGQPVEGSGLKKGIYIVGGQKIVLR